MSDQDSQRPQPPDAAIPAGREETSPYEPGSEPTAHNEAARAGRDARLHPGDTVAGRFVIVRFIARGGMGEVYEANDTALRTRVALKTMRPELAADSTSLERFRREVLLARSVAHPNVCRVFELHSTVVEGTPLTFLTMEYLEGESLAGFLTRKGPLDPAEALPLARQMAAALDAAHAHGVVHRDFKPSNVVLVTPKGAGSGAPRVVVTDFGIARTLSSSREAFETTGGTGTEGFVGTPNYVAPEQVSREVEIGPPADIYSLGVVLYEMVTGALPFDADTPMGAMLRRLKDSPRRPELVRRGLDPRWSDAILHCLETDPRRRPASAFQVLDELTRGPSRPRRRRRWIRAWGTMSLAALVVAAVVLVRFERPAATGSGSSPRTLAVLSLATQVSPADAWIGPALGQLLDAEFEDARGLRVAPWWRVAEVYPSLGIDADQVLDDEQRVRVYDLLPADEFLEGSIRCPTEPGAETCRLRLELRRRDRSILGQAEKTFLASEASSAVTELAQQARKMLGVSVDPGTDAGLAARRPRLPKVSKLLGEAVTAYTRHELAISRERLELANTIAPGDFDVEDALSRVFERQGLFVASRQAAERAVAAAGPLSSRLQQLARARVDFLGTDSVRAVAAYDAVVRDRADESEVALALSRRLPDTEALALIRRTRNLPGAPSHDLLLAIQEALLETRQGQASKARQTWKTTRERAERLKARRELSLIAELDPSSGPDLERADALARESGDRMRATYLQLLKAGDGTNNPKRLMLTDCLNRFRESGDRVGAHHVLVRRAFSERDWDAANRVLAEAATELAPTGEPLSTAYQIAMAEVELHRGNLFAAIKSLEAAETSRSYPSLELLSDLPRLGTLSDRAGLEFEVLVQQERFDEAEAGVRERLRRNASSEDNPEGYLCRLQCERGQGDEAARCFRQLLGNGPRTNRWGKAAAVCAWETGDLRETEDAAFSAHEPGVIAALLEEDVIQRYPRMGEADFKDLIARARANHDVFQELQLELLAGSGEVRAWKSFRYNPETKAQLDRGRQRLQKVAAEARRRGFTLIARKAAHELDRDPLPPASRAPR